MASNRKSRRRGGRTVRRRVLMVPVLLALLLPLAEAPTAAASPAVMSASPETYLALGDSYASGEGVEPFVPGSDSPQNRCHRSTLAYSRLLAAGPSMPPVAVSWACSGARIANFYPGQGQWHEPGQLEHLRSETRAVTLSVGGNDLQFSAVLGACVVTRHCDRKLAPFAALLLRHTVPRLAALYREVLARAGRAQIYVVGYPRFVAAAPTALCILTGLEPAETTWLNAEVVRADAALRRVVDGIADPRLHYVSTVDAFSGGEACSATGAYVHGLVPQRPVYSFHPTAAGQSLLARRLADVLGR